MLTISAELDRLGLMRTIQGLAAMGKATGLTTRFVAYDTMRSWLITGIKYTAPRRQAKPNNSKAEQKLGLAAITTDLFGDKKDKRGIIGTITPEMTSYMDWNDKLPDHVLIRLKSGAVYLVDRNLYDAGASQQTIRAHHLKYRRKDGRVTTAGQGDRKIGRWKAVDKLFVSKNAAKTYLKSQQKKVGSLKAGFVPALYHYAALSRGSIGRLPQWIANQSPEGGYGGNMSESGNGAIYATNTSHHSRAIRHDAMEQARDITMKGLKFSRNGINQRVRRLCDQFNAGQKPKPELRAA